MEIFEDITVTWGKDEFVIKGDNSIMLLIGKIESVITIEDMTVGKIPSLFKIANAYCTVLNHAGAKATVAEVYQSLFDSDETNAADVVAGLLVMMVPPAILRARIAKMKAEAQAEAKAKKKVATKAKKKKKLVASKKRTR